MFPLNFVLRKDILRNNYTDVKKKRFTKNKTKTKKQKKKKKTLVNLLQYEHHICVKLCSILIFDCGSLLLLVLAVRTYTLVHLLC